MKECWPEYRSGVSPKGTPLLERIMTKVIPVPFSGCWIWTGATYRTGYGCVFISGDENKSAHRAMLIAVGVNLKQTDIVCHTCDIRTCVNPDHLVVADHKYNIRDMHSKGRNKNRDKLTPNQVIELVSDKASTKRELCEKYNVCATTIKNLRRKFR